jgi:hypothetical protein
MLPIVPKCVVTGVRNNKSTVIEDGQVKSISEHLPNLVISDIWATANVPTDLSRIHVSNKLFPHTPPSGTYFRYITIPPDDAVIPSVPADIREQNISENHSLMHQTQTLDYVFIASGEIYLILEDGETHLEQGDIVVQRATNHAWSNRSDTPCIMVAVLIAARSEGECHEDI